MTTLRIADSISFELRWLGLIGAFEYDNYRMSFLASALFVLIMCSMGIQHVISLVNLETVEQFNDLLFVVGIYVMNCFKLSSLVFNRNAITRMFDGLNDKQMLPTNWTHSYQSDCAKAMQKFRLSSRSFLFMAFLGLIATITTTAFSRKLLFFCYFPFETRYEYSLQGYWIAYSFQVIYSIYLVQTGVIVDILIAALLHCAAVKLKVMRYECEKLCKGLLTLLSTSSKCVDNLNAIKRVVTFHIETVSYIEDIENVFSYALFVQCCLSMFSICVVLLKAIFLDIFTEPEQLLGVIIILMAFVNEIFYCCHYGNQIQHQSTKLFTSIYMCNWYNLNCTCFVPRDGHTKRNHISTIRRSILILLERTKRPTIFTAGRFIKLTYESYIMICRTGYQSFAVLRDILK